MFKLKYAFHEIDFGDFYTGSSSSDNIKKESTSKEKKSSDYKSNSDAHEPADTTVMITTMISTML